MGFALLASGQARAVPGRLSSPCFAGSLPPNNSFKPKPLRSSFAPSGFSGGFGLIQALDVTAKMYVILDKSYLDGSTASEIDDLAGKARLVISAALFHELITTRVESRVRCFSKLPQTDNPVDLFERIGNLAGLEMQTLAPAGLPSTHVLKLPFRFNASLRTEDYEFTAESIAAIADKSRITEESIDSLIELSDTTPSVFPDLASGSTEQRQEALRQAHSLIADPARVVEFFTQFQSPDPSRPFPLITDKPELWATIRWLQVRLLFTTDLYVRYQGRLAQTMTPRLRVRLEHDVHDAEILAAGAMEGALATREKKLRTWFRLIRPDGLLFPGDV